MYFLTAPANKYCLKLLDARRRGFVVVEAFNIWINASDIGELDVFVRQCV